MCFGPLGSYIFCIFPLCLSLQCRPATATARTTTATTNPPKDHLISLYQPQHLLSMSLELLQSERHPIFNFILAPSATACSIPSPSALKILLRTAKNSRNFGWLLSILRCILGTEIYPLVFLLVKAMRKRLKTLLARGRSSTCLPLDYLCFWKPCVLASLKSLESFCSSMTGATKSSLALKWLLVPQHHHRWGFFFLRQVFF